MGKRVWRKGNPPSTPGGNVHGQRQSNGQFPNAWKKYQERLSLGCDTPTAGPVPPKIHHSKIHTHPNAHSSTAYNSHDRETQDTHRERKLWDAVAHVCGERSLSHEKRPWNCEMLPWMESEGSLSKWSQRDRGWQDCIVFLWGEMKKQTQNK